MYLYYTYHHRYNLIISLYTYGFLSLDPPLVANGLLVTDSPRAPDREVAEGNVDLEEETCEIWNSETGSIPRRTCFFRMLEK